MLHTRSVFIVALGCTAAYLVPASSTRADEPRCQRTYQLGGAWVGQVDGIRFTSVQTPIDSAGRVAVLQNEWVTLNPQFKALQTAFGLAARSHPVGEIRMVGRDTARFTIVWYNGDAGDMKILTIFTMKGTLRFSDADNCTLDATLSLFLTGPLAAAMHVADADADGDLLPDTGAVPYVEIDYDAIPCRRVTTAH